jgi:HK97 family phage prohead protease
MKNMKSAVKRLDFQVQNSYFTKDASGDCIIEGYANTSSKDRVGDVVLPEAFEKTLAVFMTNPVLLANHDWNDCCGVVLSAEITDKGLFVKARISDTREDIKTLVREGCLRTFSIGYNEVVADFDEATKTKYIKELELLEISIVTVPANAEALFSVQDTKNEPADGKKSAVTKTAKALQDFIADVKTAAGKDLDGTEVSAVCAYFISNEEIMTKKELIELLKKKSAPIATAPVQEAGKAEAAAAPAAAPADGAKPEGGDMMEALKQLAAKMDAIAQGLAQLLEAEKNEDAEDAAEDSDKKPEDDKPADEGKGDKKPKDDEDEMSDEETEKALADLAAQISEIEDAEGV